LLGPVELLLGDRRVLFGPERRCQLLACLAVQAGAWIERDQVAALLWPGRDPSDARHNLRKVLFTAREMPGVQGLESSSQALRWCVETDLALLQQRQFVVAQAPVDMGWRGRPLAGLDDTGNPAWTAWLAEERARALALWQQVLRQQLKVCNDAAQSEHLALRLLEADPFDEAAAQALVAVLAASGRAAEARRLYGEFVLRLRHGLGVEPSHALRDLVARAEDARSGADGLQAPAGAAEDRAQARSTMVGRRLEARRIVQWLGTDRDRVLELVGPGGMGKSRLARTAQALLSEHFNGAAFWVAMDDLHELAAVVARIAHVLGLRLDDRVDATASLLQGLPHSPLLLVLDNAEHLPGLPALLQRLLAACPTLQLLISSRERLHLAGAQVLVLDGLAVPDTDSRDFEAATAFDAVALFVQCARAARPGFHLAPHIAAVVAIVDQLGGMPLAIELAAAWVRLLSPEAILQQLQGMHATLAVLEADPASAAARARAEHASLRAVLEQSCRGLAPREVEALVGLAVFDGGLMPDAARAVAGVSLPELARLADQSLLAVAENGRFSFHPVLAAFFDERLAQSPERQASLRGRHASFYSRYLAALAPHARGRQQVLIDGVNAEFANARAAWVHALEIGRHEWVASTSHVWRIYYEVQGRLVEGQAALRPALQLPVAGAHAWHAAAAVRHALAMLAQRLGQIDEAHSLAESAVVIGEQAQDLTAQAGGWLVLGNCAISRGLLDQARAALERALACARSAGDHHARAVVIGNLGIVEKRLGHADAAMAHYREALAAERELENHLQVGLHLNNISALHSSRGQWAEATKSIAEGRAHCRRHGVTLLLPFLALNEGIVELEQAHFQAARPHLEEALAASRQAGQLQVELSAEICLARVDLGNGEAARALQTLARLAAASQSHGMGALLADCVGCAGEALLLLGREVQAQVLLAGAAASNVADARARARWVAASQCLPDVAPLSFDDCVNRLISSSLG
jgi:predicted ATPase/DNA-binding SARP family transcriptional activator/Tfp pilus assembly protein PilF